MASVKDLTERLAHAIGVEQESNHYLIPIKSGEQAGHFQFVACTCRSCANPQNRDLNILWPTVCECFDIVQSIRKLEEARDAVDILEDQSWEDAAQCQEKVKRCLNWVQQNGGDASKITLRIGTDKSRFDLNPARTMWSGEFGFYAPEKLNISNEHAENVLGILPMEPILEADKHKISGDQVLRADIMRTALFLIYEKHVLGQNSFWKPYIDVLPRLDKCQEDRLDATYGFQDLELLKECQNGLREAWMDMKSLFGEYIFLHQAMFPNNEDSKLVQDLKSVMTFRRYMWARARASSRKLTTQEEKRYLHVKVTWKIVIIPMMDMMGILGRSVENHEYTLALEIDESDPDFGRKAKILDGLHLSIPEAFGLNSKMFLRDLQAFPYQHMLGRLSAYVRIIQANEDFLDLVDSVGIGLLTDPHRDTWVFLSQRFKSLEEGAQQALETLFLNLNIENSEDAINTLSKKRQAIVQYLKLEQATLASLVQAATDRIDSGDF